jgi:hypothetical protein
MEKMEKTLLYWKELKPNQKARFHNTRALSLSYFHLV